jgi:hypothetical protein
MKIEKVQSELSSPSSAPRAIAGKCHVIMEISNLFNAMATAQGS